MSHKKETGDNSNDHISDQLVLEPEELVLTDVTASTGVPLFKATLISHANLFHASKHFQHLVCISVLGFFLLFTFIFHLEPGALVASATKSLTQNYYFWSRSIDQTNQPVDDLIWHTLIKRCVAAEFSSKIVKSNHNLWCPLKLHTHARRLWTVNALIFPIRSHSCQPTKVNAGKN